MDTHYLEYCAGQSNGEQRAVNLHALLNMRINMNRSVLKGVRNFIRFIEALQKKEKILDEAPITTDSKRCSSEAAHEKRKGNTDRTEVI